MSGAPGVDIFLVAGEPSGDALGARLMQAFRSAMPEVHLRGVGGPLMAGQGLISLFPMSDIAVMGFLPVLAKLPTLLARIRATADAIIARPPDALVIIDSPDFTHRVAARVRRALPRLPIVDYVSPTVWAWRPGRAKKMRAYVDRVLALLPFEPEAHRRLGGPDCIYVGHPLIERLGDLRASAQELRAWSGTPATVLLLPGSRRSEIGSLLEIFGQTAARIHAAAPDTRFVLPAVPHLEEDIRARVADWPVAPEIVIGEEAKFAAFRQAQAALAASGTVTLELGLAGVPSVVGYRVPWIEEQIVRTLATAPSFILTNIILGENAVPGFLQKDCNPDALAAALAPLLRESRERRAQTQALARLDALMLLPPGETPSGRAVAAILDVVRNAKGRPEAAPASL